MMKARIIQFVEGQFIRTEVEFENIIPAMEVRGANFERIHNSKRTREELNGWPVFSSFAGPMWDGDAIRYEDVETYRTLSI